MEQTGHKLNVAFIINPKAGTRRWQSFVRCIDQYLDTSRFNISRHYTEYPGHGYSLAKQAVAERTSLVVAVGGDGTMNECARALLSTSTALSIIPMGSGNGLARDLGISSNFAQSLSTINKLHIKTIDCGIINGSHFFCTAGVGFDAEVSKKFQQLNNRGFTGYMKTALQTLPGYLSADYQVFFDHSNLRQRAFSITLANACQFGNNAIISPEAKPDDGLLDLCIIRDFPKVRAPALLHRLFSGTIDRSRYSEIHKVKKVQIICPPQSVYHLDGETNVLEGNQLNIEAIPAALKVVVP